MHACSDYVDYKIRAVLICMAKAATGLRPSTSNALKARSTLTRHDYRYAGRLKGGSRILAFERLEEHVHTDRPTPVPTPHEIAAVFCRIH